MNSRTWKAWCTPCHPVTSESKNATTVVFGCRDRLRPSCPEAGRRPDRASSAGVWIAPAATITAAARTVSRGPRRPPGRTKCPVSPVTVAPGPGHPVHPAVGVQPGAQRQRARHAGHQHRALGTGRAAAGAVVRARAVQLAAPVRDDGPALASGAGPHQLRIPPDRLRVLQPDRVPRLGLGEPGLHLPLAQAQHAPPPTSVPAPAPGSARTSPVDHRGPAHAPALGEHHRRPAHRHPAAPVAVQGPQRPHAAAR